MVKSTEWANLSVGCTVRVAWQGVARRATVACLGDVPSEEPLQVIFDDDNSEAHVKADDVRLLEDFESQPASCAGGIRLSQEAARCREEGNALFRLGDSAAAAERYSAAINALGVVEEGESSALVLAASGSALWAADASWKKVEEATGDLSPLACVGGGSAKVSEAPRKAARSKLLKVQDGALGDLQAALYLNRARCWLALGAAPRAVQDSGIAASLRKAVQPQTGSYSGCYSKRLQMSGVLKLAVGLGTAIAFGGPAADDSKTSLALLMVAVVGALLYFLALLWRKNRLAAVEAQDPRLCTAHFLRGRARVFQGRLKAAEEELSLAKASAASDAQRSELQKLSREILEARRGNKRLAKEVAKWCEAAMARASPDAFVTVAQRALADEAEVSVSGSSKEATLPAEGVRLRTTCPSESEE
eukprot:TRINITY_DN111557_c0_g1_i1.p1 TRINITY_DN111557_c0_g1~~TRINITY_DN111557_c0_g1_i1.p1  ORF type:complete len:432 (+),score=102.48 TRINITY_DN111557_c0_g1_i1:42-1298(+)